MPDKQNTAILLDQARANVAKAKEDIEAAQDNLNMAEDGLRVAKAIIKKARGGLQIAKASIKEARGSLKRTRDYLDQAEKTRSNAYKNVIKAGGGFTVAPITGLSPAEYPPRYDSDDDSKPTPPGYAPTSPKYSNSP